MPPGYANRWWENVILSIVAGIGLWPVYGPMTSLADAVEQMFA